MKTWQESAAEYLERLRDSEGSAQVKAYRKTRKGKKDWHLIRFRYQPSEYHLDLLEALKADDETRFKSKKMLEGYASELGV